MLIKNFLACTLNIYFSVFIGKCEAPANKKLFVYASMQSATSKHQLGYNHGGEIMKSFYSQPTATCANGKLLYKIPGKNSE